MSATFLSESIRWRYLNFDSVMMTGYPLLLSGAWLLPLWHARVGLLGAVTAIGFYAGFRAYRRYRCIADTPTSRLASAAQGYTELAGAGDLFGPDDGIGFAWTPPAVWLRYAVYRRTGERWGLVERGQSASVFLLDDGTGHCLVDPEGAEIHATRRFSQQQGDFLYRGEYIAPGDTIYALGLLRTEGGRIDVADRRSDIGALLSTWKRDPRFLLNRFDRNGDGEIDLQEWQAVRREAAANIDSRRRDSDYDPVRHRLSRAGGWRPYLLSVLPERAIARRYRNWAALHLLLFLIAGTLTVMSAQAPPPGPPTEVPLRQAFITAPRDLAVSVDGRLLVTQPPFDDGRSEVVLYRVSLPIGAALFELRYPNGDRLQQPLQIPATDSLLLITVSHDRANPVRIR